VVQADGRRGECLLLLLLLVVVVLMLEAEGIRRRR